MQKVTAFLEQHVQWIAIGLGALFCLYMIYGYVITPPAVANINGTQFGPSEIDPHTAETVVAKLQSAMQNSSRIKMEVPQYVQAFEEAMTWKNAKPVALEGMTDRALTLNVLMPPPPQQQPGIAGGPVQGFGPQQGAVVAETEKVTQLPVPPAPKQLDPNVAVKYGRSVIIPPPGPGQAAQIPPPGVVPPNAIDLDWVTQMWTISMGDIENVYRQARLDKLPPELRKTMFLHVEMVREEMVDGKWQNAMVIPHRGPTRNNQPMLPYPGDGPDQSLRQAQFQYAAWASTSTSDIIQPLFHVTLPNKGDQWTKPGAQLMAAAMFNPATHVGGKGNLTEEQWQAVLQYRREQYRLLQEQKKANQPAPRTTPGGRGVPPEMMEGDGGMYAPARGPAARTRNLPNYAPAPGRPPPYPTRGGYGGYGGMPPEMMEMEGEAYDGGYGGGITVPNMPQPGTDYPMGEFDPVDTTTVPAPPWKLDPLTQRPREVEMWAHDDQVAPGKTYRYKMRYRLKNPIFGTNASDNQSLVDQFALVSPFSEWSTPITVPALVNFFVAGGFVPGRGTVDFEIFRWDQGQQKLERFSVGPGDLVGWEKNGIDFSTDWTVVDFRDDPRAGDAQILLVNNKDGSVVARSFATDRNDKLYQALSKQVKDAKAAEAAAIGAAGGIVPPGMVPPGNGTAAAR